MMAIALNILCIHDTHTPTQIANVTFASSFHLVGVFNSSLYVTIALFGDR